MIRSFSFWRGANSFDTETQRREEKELKLTSEQQRNRATEKVFNYRVLVHEMPYSR
jgi:hypothetical protein